MSLPRRPVPCARAACRVADASDGAYDPTLGALVDLWGFGPPGPVIARRTRPLSPPALARSGWRRLALDCQDRSALQPGGLQLDLSGSAKGHAVDAVSDLLLAEGFANHLVEIGGELRGRGLKPDRQPWWVALEAPFGDGDTRRGPPRPRRRLLGGPPARARPRGPRIGHTLDGRTGRPIDNGVNGATVLHASCLMADALATAVMVLGPEHGRAFAAAHDLACLTGGQGTPDWDWISPAAQRMMA